VWRSRVIESHEELEVYKLAFQAAMRIFALTKQFLHSIFPLPVEGETR
jgi:hypothetical protein